MVGWWKFRSLSIILNFIVYDSRYKESITKTTRGWKDRLFARNSQMPDHPTVEVRRQSDPGIATVSRMMDHLEIAGDGTRNTTTVLHNSDDESTPNPTQRPSLEIHAPSSEDDNRGPCVAGSTSN